MGTYLCVDDYGMGGIWFLIDAKSPNEVEHKLPGVKAFGLKPDWMSKKDHREYLERCEKLGFHWHVDNPKGWLLEYLESQKKSKES